jgi:hypothetical protein
MWMGMRMNSGGYIHGRRRRRRNGQRGVVNALTAVHSNMKVLECFNTVEDFENLAAELNTYVPPRNISPWQLLLSRCDLPERLESFGPPQGQEQQCVHKLATAHIR